MNPVKPMYLSDRKLDIYVDIMKVLEKHRCKYIEWNYISYLLNDSIYTQREEDPSESGVIEYSNRIES